MTTLSDLRALLERALTHDENPAIVRLTERTVEGVALAYLGRGVWITVQDHGYVGFEQPVKYYYWHDRPYVDAVLDVPDAGTAHAAVVALALALGLDPGVGGVSCLWEHAGECWMLTTSERTIVFEPEDEEHGIAAGDVTFACLSWICAPTVALEPDPIKALCLAVRCILETP